MKIIVPDYYYDFNCIADKCKHTCCKGWEVEIDEASIKRFEQIPDVERRIERGEDNHFRLLEGDVCPFLLENGLCDMIIKYGEDFLCQTCTDHPRFRNYWEDRVEMGLGMVCEEAARLILSRKSPMKLVVYESDETDVSKELPEDELWLMNFRDNMLRENPEEGPIARFREYLIYRHIADALYDDSLEERVNFIDDMVEMVKKRWQESDGTMESLIEIVRIFSYDIEYDEDEKEKYLA